MKKIIRIDLHIRLQIQLDKETGSEMMPRVSLPAQGPEILLSSARKDRLLKLLKEWALALLKGSYSGITCPLNEDIAVYLKNCLQELNDSVYV